MDYMDMAFNPIYELTKKHLDKLAPKDNPLDKQVGGEHYKKYAIQPIEYITANNLPYIEGNVVKYISRWRDKDGVKDLKKIIHYCEILIASEEQALKAKEAEKEKERLSNSL